MINIHVESDIMNCSIAIKSDSASYLWLRRILKIHVMQRIRLAGPKPIRKKYYKREGRLYRKHLEAWENRVKTLIPIKINITHN